MSDKAFIDERHYIGWQEFNEAAHFFKEAGHMTLVYGFYWDLLLVLAQGWNGIYLYLKDSNKNDRRYIECT